MALRGNLRDFSLPDVFQLVTLSGKTGVLRIKRADGAEGSVWFRDGEVFFAQSDWHREPLGSGSSTRGKITPERARRRRSRSRGPRRRGGRRLGQILVDEGYISEKVLEAFVQEQIQDTIFDLLRWDEGEFDFETARGRARRGHRSVGLHREHRHGGLAPPRGVEPHQEEDPVDGHRLQDGDGAGRGHVRDLAQADRVEPAAQGRRHALGRRTRARVRAGPTSRSLASSTVCSRPACWRSPPTTRSSGCAPSAREMEAPPSRPTDARSCRRSARPPRPAAGRRSRSRGRRRASHMRRGAGVPVRPSRRADRRRHGRVRADDGRRARGRRSRRSPRPRSRAGASPRPEPEPSPSSIRRRPSRARAGRRPERGTRAGTGARAEPVRASPSLEAAAGRPPDRSRSPAEPSRSPSRSRSRSSPEPEPAEPSPPDRGTPSPSRSLRPRIEPALSRPGVARPRAAGGRRTSTPYSPRHAAARAKTTRCEPSPPSRTPCVAEVQHRVAARGAEPSVPKRLRPSRRGGAGHDGLAGDFAPICWRSASASCPLEAEGRSSARRRREPIEFVSRTEEAPSGGRRRPSPSDRSTDLTDLLSTSRRARQRRRCRDRGDPRPRAAPKTVLLADDRRAVVAGVISTDAFLADFDASRRVVLGGLATS